MRIIDTITRSFTGTSADSAALSDEGGYVLLQATAACHFRFVKKGATTAATTADTPILETNKMQGPFKFQGQEHIAVIQNATGGTLYITRVIPQDYD